MRLRGKGRVPVLSVPPVLRGRHLRERPDRGVGESRKRTRTTRRRRWKRTRKRRRRRRVSSKGSEERLHVVGPILAGNNRLSGHTLRSTKQYKHQICNRRKRCT